MDVITSVITMVVKAVEEESGERWWEMLKFELKNIEEGP
jgi:hypothetical protein